MVREYTCFIVDDEDLILQRLELFFKSSPLGISDFIWWAKRIMGWRG